MDTLELMRKRHGEVAAAIAKIQKEADPLRARREAINTQVSPLNDEAREINQKLKALEQPALSNLKKELDVLSRALKAGEGAA